MFYHLGRLVATSIGQGGSGLPCLSPGTYAYLCGSNVAEIMPTSDEVRGSDIYRPHRPGIMSH